MIVRSGGENLKTQKVQGLIRGWVLHQKSPVVIVGLHGSGSFRLCLIPAKPSSVNAPPLIIHSDPQESVEVPEGSSRTNLGWALQSGKGPSTHIVLCRAIFCWYTTVLMFCEQRGGHGPGPWIATRNLPVICRTSGDRVRTDATPREPWHLSHPSRRR